MIQQRTFLRLASLVLAVLITGAARLPPAAAATWFVNNVVGNDAWDGASATAIPEKRSGPFATISRAVAHLKTSDRLELANTGKPYREALVLTRPGGTAERPMVIDGNGATIDGLDVVPQLAWRLEPDGAFSVPFQTQSQTVENSAACTCWIDAPQIWFVDGRPAPNAKARDRIPPGGLFYHKREHRVYFRLPEGLKLSDVKVEIPVRDSGVGIYCNYVIVRNLRSIHSLNDGFGSGNARGLIFQKIVAEDNCDQGFSAHGVSENLIEDSRLVGNAGCGIIDVGRSISIYRRCIISDNTCGAGAHFQYDGFHALEYCRIERNEGVAVRTSGENPVHLVHCLIRGKEGSTDPLVRAGSPVVARNCTLIGGRIGIQVEREGALRLANSLLWGSRQELMAIAPGAETRFMSDGNAYQLGSLLRARRRYTAADWDAYREESGQDARSVVVGTASPPLNPLVVEIPDWWPIKLAPRPEKLRPAGVDLTKLPPERVP